MTLVTKQTSSTTIEEFVTDESSMFRASDIEAVYFPESHEEVAEVIAQANEEGTLVTVSGAGTGLVGGRVAVHGGVVLSTDKLCAPAARDLAEITTTQFGTEYTVYVDEAAMAAHVPAGIPLDLFQEMLPEGLMYPASPTETSCHIGATIAMNSSGPLTFRYGATREWVEGLRVVLPTGDSLEVERGEIAAEDGKLSYTSAEGNDYVIPVPSYEMPKCKNAAGLYAKAGMDLVDIFIGCEGILGVVTDARVKLTEDPGEIISQIAFFDVEGDAMGFVRDMRRAAEEDNEMEVLAIEFLDRNSLRFMHHESLEGKEYTGIYTQVVGSLDALEPLLLALEENNCAEDWLAETERDRQELVEFRHSLPDSLHAYLRRHNTQKLGLDLVTPGEHFEQMMARYRAAEQAFREEFPRDGEHFIIYGHIGDYHVHANFIPHSREELQFCQRLYLDLAGTAVGWGGTISGEHGIGKKRLHADGEAVPYLQVMYGEEGLHEVARAKKAVDPRLLLNVGNMVPREVLEEA